MPDFHSIVETALLDGDLLCLVLSKPCKGCTDSEDKLTVRPVELKSGRYYQWSAQSNGQERHENLSPEDTLERASELFGSAYAHGHVYTSKADHSVRKNRKGKIHVSSSAASQRPKESPKGHNREKQYLLPENEPCAFLAEIGVMTPEGKVKASHYKKFRQINRYLEIVNDVVPHLPKTGPLKVVDFGCGKSYLTFALHHLLTALHKRDVQIVGLDRKADVVRHCREIAHRLGCRGLEFREGDLWGHQEEEIHLAVSLHACDTATDEALAKAVAWNADAILAVPCCQHEMAAKLPPAVWPVVQKHGILKDRMAAMITDSLRAQALEALGYKTQVIEFIDMEHTAKNVLIRAIRRPEGAGNSRSAVDYDQFKEQLGIDSFHLDLALTQLGIETLAKSSSRRNFKTHE